MWPVLSEFAIFRFVEGLFLEGPPIFALAAIGALFCGAMYGFPMAVILSTLALLYFVLFAKGRPVIKFLIVMIFIAGIQDLARQAREALPALWRSAVTDSANSREAH
jgi:hypothetical protein